MWKISALPSHARFSVFILRSCRLFIRSERFLLCILSRGKFSVHFIFLCISTWHSHERFRWKFSFSLLSSHVSSKVFYSSLNELFIHFEQSHEVSVQIRVVISFLLSRGTPTWWHCSVWFHVGLPRKFSRKFWFLFFLIHVSFEAFLHRISSRGYFSWGFHPSHFSRGAPHVDFIFGFAFIFLHFPKSE